ncbi:hypothetical protein N657DRAFT_533107, partial [Parathielavia appendiculata]
RCACSALFQTEGGLHEHLQEYRSREQRLRAEAELCQAHWSTGDDRGGQSDCDDNRGNEDNDLGNPTSRIGKDKSHGGHYCPDGTCPHSGRLWKKQALRRHYQQHVPCEEVCVVCFKVMRLTSEFLRHVEKHISTSGRKMTFIRATCDELRERSDAQLDLALKKRKFGVAG